MTVDLRTTTGIARATLVACPSTDGVKLNFWRAASESRSNASESYFKVTPLARKEAQKCFRYYKILVEI